jgi:anti-sigma factor ChrR (cupin superfamily)
MTMEAVRYMVHCRLNRLAEARAAALVGESHPDEDIMSAFIEGRTSEVETKFIVAHLTDCNSCRAASARLIRLELMLTAQDEPATPTEGPSRFSQFIEGLASQVIPAEDAVFAYHHPDEEGKSTSEDPADESE